LIATRNISRGTLVLEEIPTLGLKEVDAGKIAEEFHKLPRTKQDQRLYRILIMMMMQLLKDSIGSWITKQQQQVLRVYFQE